MCTVDTWHQKLGTRVMSEMLLRPRISRSLTTPDDAAGHSRAPQRAIRTRVDASLRTCRSDLWVRHDQKLSSERCCIVVLSAGMQKLASGLAVCNFEKQEKCSPEMKKLMDEIKTRSTEDLLAEMKKIDDEMTKINQEYRKAAEELEVKDEKANTAKNAKVNAVKPMLGCGVMIMLLVFLFLVEPVLRQAAEDGFEETIP